MANHYDILQVPREATIDQIKAAFRRLARLYHPDLNPDNPDAAEKFREIELAYEILRDPARRERYDRETNPTPPETPTGNRSATDFYETGLRYAKERAYPRAIENYTRAIEIDPNLWIAYLKRAEANYENYQDRAIFEDCRQVLQLNPDCGEAYYYLGLARQRLGYTQSSIEAYNKAIDLDPNAARVYYQRGLAREELSEYTEVLRDWQEAAEKFQKAGDFSRYRFLQRKIKALRKTHRQQKKQDFFQILKSSPVLVWSVFKILGASLANPRGGLNSAFLKFGKDRALETGIIAGGIGGFCLAMSWQKWSVNLPIEQLVILGILPFLIIALSSYTIRKLGKSYGYIAGDFFVGAFSFLPVSIALSLNSILSPNENIVGFTVGMASVYSAWIGYNAYISISNIRPRIALVFSPFVMFFVGVLIWGVYYYL